MLVIRFLRRGKKNQPFFRIVVTDKRNPPKGGRFLEILGFYNPLTKEKKVKAERVKHWLSIGAQPSDTVYNLLISEGVIEGKKLPVHSKTKKKKEKGEKKEEKPKEEKPEVKPEEKPIETKEKEEKTEEEKPEVKSAAPEGSEPRPENSGREEKPAETKAKEEKPKEPVSAGATTDEEKPVEKKPKEPASAEATAGREKP